MSSFGQFSVAWDFSTLELDLESFPSLYGAKPAGQSNPVQNNATVVNVVSVAVAGAGTALDAVTASQDDSIELYGRQQAQPFIGIFENALEAKELAVYLVEPQPQYWFSNIRIQLNGLDPDFQDQVASVEVGDQIVVSKRFPKVADPITQQLFVEGIEHEITTNGHIVVITTSPGYFWRCFILDCSQLDDPKFGLAGSDPCTFKNYLELEAWGRLLLEDGDEILLDGNDC